MPGMGFGLGFAGPVPGMGFGALHDLLLQVQVAVNLKVLAFDSNLKHEMMPAGRSIMVVSLHLPATFSPLGLLL
jgi:hypothetical protein